ncbi:MAG: hypothetical protein FJX67_05565 [Alphaproteobacteria bacterium]|nr:hypothetical protein [Alphaproteobacteria bacterium]
MATPRAGLVPRSGNPLIDGVLSGAAWNTAASNVITWGTADIYGFGMFWPSPSTAAAVIDYGLREIEKVANLDFVYVGHYADPTFSAGDITFTIADTSLIVAAFGLPFAGLAVFPSVVAGNQFLAALGLTRAQYPQPEGDVLINRDIPTFNTPVSGTEAFATGLHELGHALGLKHPHDSGGLGPYPTFAQLGLKAIDYDIYTVMSYNELNNTWPFAGHPATPMPIDILALQYLYGANTRTATGNDTYFLQDDGVFRTVWDAGGTDTFDASWFAAPNGLRIDLREGAMTFVTSVSGTAIAFNTVIENAVGTIGPDVIIGNRAANRIEGGPGNDHIDGGAGTDTAVYVGGRNEFVVTVQGNAVLVRDTAALFNQGTDTLFNIEFLQFTDTTVSVGLETGGAVGVGQPVTGGLGAGAAAPVYRFYNTHTGVHFYTGSTQERDTVIATLPHFNYEGAAFAIPAAAPSDVIPVYRFYNTAKGVHFYTASASERDHIVASTNDPFLAAFALEGVGLYGFSAPGADTTPLHRFYNDLTGTHFYTASEAERAGIVANPSGNPFLAHMHYEGVAF